MSTPPKSGNQLLKEAIHMLGEHFGTVQIFVTKTEDGATDMFSGGEGNFCARYGCIKEWMIIQEEKFRIRARKQNEGES